MPPMKIIKLNVMEVKSESSIAYLIESLAMWHARLWHINLNSIKNMIKLKMISTSNIEKQENAVFASTLNLLDNNF